MGPGLLSAALLFVGSFVLYAEHYSVSERSRRGPSQEQARGPGRLGRQKGLLAQKKEGWAAEGSIFIPLIGRSSLPFPYFYSV